MTIQGRPGPSPLLLNGGRAELVDWMSVAALRPAVRQGSELVAVVALTVEGGGDLEAALGVGAGWRLQAVLATRLAQTLSQGDAVAQLPELSTLVVLTGRSQRAAVDEVVQRVRARLGEPAMVANEEVFPRLSSGLALLNADELPERAVERALLALGKARELGGGGHREFDATMSSALGKLRLEGELRHALAAGDLVFHMQPFVHMKDGELAGFEALVRWPHPSRGVLGPAHFVPLSEAIGLDGELARAALGAASRSVADWAGAGVAVARQLVSVNISGRLLNDADLPVWVAAAVSQMRAHGGTLVLEVTESSLAENPRRAAAALDRLRQLGVLLALDDFGTGYSALAQLEMFHFDWLKVDRGFVRRLQSPTGREVLRAVISMAQGMGMTVVAEGIETPEQFAELRALGVDIGQGFLFSAAVAPLAARDMALAGSWRTLVAPTAEPEPPVASTLA